ncbi:MAG TPA: RlpA-like double-psi beta-barrel domain-containing protein [Solirubrobacteraceae bacterium]|jgi:rare lipoprotein A|nr:RlpA-like double-psi beta-barrel domain-containing protein [Solirubrobacteraceae bacterium]
MYVPATLALPAPATPVSASSVFASAAPARTALHVRRADLDVLAGQSATVTGTLRSTGAGAPRGSAPLAGATVVLQVRERRDWRTLAGTRTGARGRFSLRYRPRRIGSELLRVRFAGDGAERGSHRRLGLLNVFRLADASWYGGGGSLACGGWLTSATLGVANKTLPCGTLVTLRYGGHTVRVPVIDRGPYVAGREYDLTEATKRALGFAGTGEVWATR